MAVGAGQAPLATAPMPSEPGGEDPIQALYQTGGQWRQASALDGKPVPMVKNGLGRAIGMQDSAATVQKEDPGGDLIEQGRPSNAECPGAGR